MYYSAPINGTKEAIYHSWRENCLAELMQKGNKINCFFQPSKKNLTLTANFANLTLNR